MQMRMVDFMSQEAHRHVRVSRPVKLHEMPQVFEPAVADLEQQVQVCVG